MFVQCVDKANQDGYLTAGKVYRVENTDDAVIGPGHDLILVCDTGTQDRFPSELFAELSDTSALARIVADYLDEEIFRWREASLADKLTDQHAKIIEATARKHGIVYSRAAVEKELKELAAVVAHYPLDTDFQHYTVIDTDGNVLSKPSRSGSLGVVICSVADNKPILVVSELSDHEVVNLTITPVGPTSGMIPAALARFGYEVLADREKRQ